MQLAMQLPDTEAATRAWLRVRDAFAQLVDVVGLKEAAYRLDVRASQLADAIAERDRHRVAAEWVVHALTWAPELCRAALVAALCEAAQFEGAKPKVLLTSDEQIRRLTEALQRFGEAGENEIQKALGRSK